MAAHMQQISHLHYIYSIQSFHSFCSITELKIGSTEFIKVGSISFNSDCLNSIDFNSNHLYLSNWKVGGYENETFFEDILSSIVIEF